MVVADVNGSGYGSRPAQLPMQKRRNLALKFLPAEAVKKGLAQHDPMRVFDTLPTGRLSIERLGYGAVLWWKVS